MRGQKLSKPGKFKKSQQDTTRLDYGDNSPPVETWSPTQQLPGLLVDLLGGDRLIAQDLVDVLDRLRDGL